MIVNNLPGKHGVDTGDATATAADIISPKTAYVNGEKVTGTLAEQSAASYQGDDVKMTFTSASGNVLLYHNLTDRICVKANASIGLAAQASRFGDATAGDVAAGKTFTSAAGLNVTGTSPAVSYETVKLNGVFSFEPETEFSKITKILGYIDNANDESAKGYFEDNSFWYSRTNYTGLTSGKITHDESANTLYFGSPTGLYSLTGSITLIADSSQTPVVFGKYR